MNTAKLHDFRNEYVSIVIGGKWSQPSFYCSSDYWSSFKSIYFDNQRNENELPTIRCYAWSSGKEIKLPSSRDFFLVIKWHPHLGIFIFMGPDLKPPKWSFGKFWISRFYLISWRIIWAPPFSSSKSYPYLGILDFLENDTLRWWILTYFTLHLGNFSLDLATLS